MGGQLGMAGQIRLQKVPDAFEFAAGLLAKLGGGSKFFFVPLLLQLAQ